MNFFKFLIFCCFYYSISEALECSAPIVNKAIVVHDLKTMKGQLSECCGFCKSTPGCKAYSWSDFDGGECLLKDDVEPVIDLAGVTMAILQPDTPEEKPLALISKPKSSSSSSSSVFTNQVSLDIPFSGHFTFYKKVGRGACGEMIDAENEEFAALSFRWFTKSKISKDPVCNYCLEINYNGKSLTVPINDRCPFCPSDQVYLSHKAFAKLQDPTSVGAVYGSTFIIVQCE